VARKCPNRVHKWKRNNMKKRNQGRDYTSDITQKNYPKEMKGNMAQLPCHIGKTAENI
jgi:hypothetical protein